MKKYLVELLAIGNVSSSTVTMTLAGYVEPILRALLLFGQFAVAVVTVIYIVRKLRNEKRAPTQKEPEEDDKLDNVL